MSRHIRFIGTRRLLIASAMLALIAPAAAVAQATGTSADTGAQASSVSERRLARDIRASFRVLPIQNGIILVPVSPRHGVDNVELREGTIAVNGTVVTGAELRQRLGRDADAVIELSYLDPGAQRRLLPGSSGAAAPSQKEQEPAAKPEPSEPPESEASPGESPAAESERTFRRVSNGRVRVGGSIRVDEDEEVNGPVVAIGGTVDIDGRVREDVVAVGGNVHLGPKAEVHGDVTSVGGSISRDPSAVISGHVNEIEFSFPNFHVRPRVPWDVHVVPWWGDGPWRTVRLFGTVVRMSVFGILAALILLVAPRGVERVGTAVRSEPWKAGLVGFLAQVVFFPLLALVTLFLLISIIGIPLLVLIPFAVLVFFLALMLGFTGTAESVARTARERFGWVVPGPFVLLLLGLAIIWGVTLLGRVISIAGGPFVVIGGVLLFVGFLVEYIAWTVGLGGTILTRFGRFGGFYAPPVAPPPPPVSSAPEPPADELRQG